MQQQIEFSGKTVAILLALLILTVAPLYVFTGQPTGFVLGVPVWSWLLFVVHFAMLGLVALLVRELGGVESLAGVRE